MNNILRISICVLAMVLVCLSGPPNNNPFDMCCKVEKSPDVDVYVTKITALAKECMDADKSDAKGPEKLERVQECIAKKKNMIDDAGNLQEAGITAALKEMPLSQHQKSIVEGTVKTCLAAAKNTKEGQIFHKLVICLDKEFSNACPKDLQDTSEQCNNMRAGKI